MLPFSDAPIAVVIQRVAVQRFYIVIFLLIRVASTVLGVFRPRSGLAILTGWRWRRSFLSIGSPLVGRTGVLAQRSFIDVALWAC
jgi:hypothetical protein